MSDENSSVHEPAGAPAVSLDVKTILKRLAALQKNDALSDQWREKIEGVPKMVQAIQDQVEAEKARAASAKEREKTLLLEHKNLELEVAKKDGEINKHGGSLQQVKTNDAYKALLTEIENLKSGKDQVETKILEVMEQIDQEKKHQVEASKSFEATKKELEAEKARLEAEKVQWESELAKTVEARQNLVKDIPESEMKHYELLRRKKAGVAIVPLSDGTSCGSCRLSATQQVINDLKKGRTFVECERCQRILYLPE